MPRITVSTVYLRALLDGAGATGVRFDDLLADLGLGAVVANPDGRVERARANALWEAIAQRSGDPAFGLHLAERLEPGAFAVLDYAARNAPTLGEAYARMVRYARLIHEAAEVAVHQHGDQACLSYRLTGSSAASPRHAAAFFVGIWLVSTRQMLECNVVPSGVRFQHPRPADISEHRRLFGCPIEFNAPANEMHVERALLARPLAKADPRLAALLDHFAEQMLEKLPRTETLRDRVRHLVAEALRDGDPTVELLAKRLGMSARTLQRRLRDDGTSHQELLDEIRRELAHEYLREPSIAIGEAAFLLGFSEPSAFHRAFKRWTGTTPGEYRRRSITMH